MATYNGAEFVADQIKSILMQLRDGDELVVVDDASHDGTVEVVQAVAGPALTLVRHQSNRGYVQSFADSLSVARGDLMLLADQDDVWLPGRLDLMVASLVEHDVVATNLSVLHGPQTLRGPYGQTDWHLRADASGHRARNVLGVLVGNRPYYGSAMGLRREALDTVLPFPEYLIESHDLWIALYGNLVGRMGHLEQRTVARRFHDANASPSRPRAPRQVLASRLLLMRCTMEMLRRRRSRR